MAQADVGIIGLAVMGRNLVLNLADRGYMVAVYNRERTMADEFLAGPGRRRNIIGTSSLEELIGSLKRPRRVMMLVKARAVDPVIRKLEPLLAPGDIVIDGGNSHYRDTARRTRSLAGNGIMYIGAGISGGAAGARNGPSIMAGGNPAAWPRVKEIFQSIAARAGGEPCCGWVGEEGAGHFVKMVHNGIEYADMQLICEAYDFMRRGLGLDEGRLQAVFTEWNRGPLNSYLIEITAEILGFRKGNGHPLLNRILDIAGQKGTGKWAGISAFELDVPLNLTGEAVFARFLSSRKEERVSAAKLLHGPSATITGNADELIPCVQDALYAGKIIAYAQGYMLMRAAALKYGWQLNYGSISRMWRGGCIIRSGFLDNVEQAFIRNPDLENLLLDDFFRRAVNDAQTGWRRAVTRAVDLGVPVPAFSSALAYYDGYRSRRLPANLLQAQRDYFGAHGFERDDRPRGEYFHADWGEVTSER